MNVTQARSVFQSKHRFTVTPSFVRSCALIIILVCPFHVKSRFSLIFVFVFVLKELVSQIESLQDSKV